MTAVLSFLALAALATSSPANGEEKSPIYSQDDIETAECLVAVTNPKLFENAEISDNEEDLRRYTTLMAYFAGKLEGRNSSHNSTVILTAAQIAHVRANSLGYLAKCSSAALSGLGRQIRPLLPDTQAPQN